ncbi:MAG: hypothetical protein WA970_13540 [Gammaproteobacteria bacterium]
MAVGIFEDTVALVVQVLPVSRYPQIGEGGHEAFSEETAVSYFIERISSSLYDIVRASKNCTKELFFWTDVRECVFQFREHLLAG